MQPVSFLLHGHSGRFAVRERLPIHYILWRPESIPAA
ncbi:hypothetical protein B2K_38305 [Paenibacillus mucilaginosus K02]|uniref:Uncharacterized protein n=1 Tax=Paenibacillus mucilaginosus K02 TaxID=997761 RepID=R9UL33_9BACL|nr:hypothetical protein B2K_38305 [Paenibacillus mucilaginosus K02]